MACATTCRTTGTNATAAPLPYSGMEYGTLAASTTVTARSMTASQVMAWNGFTFALKPSPLIEQSSYRWFNNQNAASKLTFAKTDDNTSSQTATSLIRTPSGYALLGNDGASSNALGYVDRFDTTGNHLQHFGITNGTLDPESWDDIKMTNDGGYIIGGGSYYYDGMISYQQATIMKYDSFGTLSWSVAWGSMASGGSELANAVVPLANGSYVALGSTPVTGAGFDNFVLTYSSGGALTSSKNWGGTANEMPTSAVATSDGGYIVAGTTASYGAGSDDAFISKFDSSGNLSWSKTWGGTAADSAASVVQSSDGGYVLAGTTMSYGSGSYDTFIARYDASGAVAGCAATMCQDSSAVATGQTATSSAMGATLQAITLASSPYGPTQVTTMPYTITTLVAGPGPLDVGAPLANVNTAAAPSSYATYRLRMVLRVTASQDAATPLKLQYAAMSGTCDTAFSGESYADVTAVSPIAFGNNVNADDGMTILANANDPSSTAIRQSYEESGNIPVANSLAASQDGMWDIALKSNGAPLNTTYCFRMVRGSGQLLNTYTYIPQLTTPAVPAGPTLDQQLRGGQSVTNGIKTPLNF